MGGANYRRGAVRQCSCNNFMCVTKYFCVLQSTCILRYPYTVYSQSRVFTLDTTLDVVRYNDSELF
jgi:hypothetical protein